MAERDPLVVVVEDDTSVREALVRLLDAGGFAATGHATAEDFLAGADIVYGAGLLQAAKIFSFEQLLLDCEMFEMLRYLAAGIPVDDESLAVEVIEAVGPGGHFMEQEHTVAHMREIWQPRLLADSVLRRAAAKDGSAVLVPVPESTQIERMSGFGPNAALVPAPVREKETTLQMLNLKRLPTKKVNPPKQ
mgnify:CR=1 FL=1